MKQKYACAGVGMVKAKVFLSTDVGKGFTICGVWAYALYGWPCKEHFVSSRLIALSYELNFSIIKKQAHL